MGVKAAKLKRYPILFACRGAPHRVVATFDEPVTRCRNLKGGFSHRAYSTNRLLNGLLYETLARGNLAD